MLHDGQTPPSFSSETGEPLRETLALRSIPETSTIQVSFNIMPDRPVSETLVLKEYRLGESYIEAVFDREYASTMLNSPDHLIFLTALAHCQRLGYVYLCHYFERPYEPQDNEILKIWPVSVKVEMARMIRKRRDVVQKMWVTSITKEAERQYLASMRSTIEDLMSFEIVSKVFLL